MIGVVAHRPLLYEDMTCMENLLFFGRMYGLKDLHERARARLRLVGLDGHGQRKVRTLSHGMQKRLAIARATLHDPAVPPHGRARGGDWTRRRWRCWAGNFGAGRRWDAPWSWTTHNLEQGLAWGDRVAILSGGKIAFEESRHSLDVASFAGTYRQLLEATP